MQIFVSHKTEDRNSHPELWERLSASHVAYWDASSMPIGATLQEKLREGIRFCDACIFLATENSIASQWCLAELGAFWGAGKPVIPFIAGNGVDETRLPPYLRELVWTKSAAVAVEQAREAAAKRRRQYPAVVFDAFDSDGDAVAKIRHLLDTASVPLTSARLIQYSAAHVVGLLETLTEREVAVQLLLIHPAQLFKDANYPLMDQQLGKLKTSYSSRDFGETLEVKYYLQPASLRGISVPNVMCALGWYSHEEHWLYGHRNATVIAHGPDVGKTGLWDTFDRVFSKMWADAIAKGEDQENLDRLLNLNLSNVIGKTRLEGIVVRGHGVASGASLEGLGTLAQQAQYLSTHIDWREVWQGTINVSISPKAFAWRQKAPTLSRVPWSDHQPPEDFCLAPCDLEVNGATFKAWVYHPHPRTKSQNFHNPSIVEIIAPRIDGLSYGSAVALYLDNSQFAVW